MPVFFYVQLLTKFTQIAKLSQLSMAQFKPCKAFAQFGLPAMNELKELSRHLSSVSFRFQLAKFNSQQVKKYGQDGGCDFGQFLGIASYLLLCQKLFAKFNNQGKVVFDLQGLTNIGMWFL
ncbi:Programmed_cell death protein-like protein [Hexamita inflata]|uniref:Programmed cell death protein-like protein n=1 Tax=Hexamita inflata TaxID=28002 RepID=A0AA86QSJ9_9EUKA|nr:Programmed cell death protein-like protein [Hexamita inflata]